MLINFVPKNVEIKAFVTTLQNSKESLEQQNSGISNAIFGNKTNLKNETVKKKIKA